MEAGAILQATGANVTIAIVPRAGWLNESPYPRMGFRTTGYPAAELK
jgi:hypothetical protein